MTNTKSVKELAKGDRSPNPYRATEIRTVDCVVVNRWSVRVYFIDADGSQLARTYSPDESVEVL